MCLTGGHRRVWWITTMRRMRIEDQGSHHWRGWNVARARTEYLTQEHMCVCHQPFWQPYHLSTSDVLLSLAAAFEQTCISRRQHVKLKLQSSTFTQIPGSWGRDRKCMPKNNTPHTCSRQHLSAALNIPTDKERTSSQEIRLLAPAQTTNDTRPDVPQQR